MAGQFPRIWGSGRSNPPVKRRGLGPPTPPPPPPPPADTSYILTRAGDRIITRDGDFIVTR